MDQLEANVGQVVGNDLIARIIIAAVIVVAIAVLTHLAVMSVKRFIDRDSNRLVQSSIIINIVRGVMWGVGLCLMLDSCFNVNMSALIAALGVGGIALSLGFQDTLSNLIGGIQISFMRVIAPGDNIQVANSRGVVQDITWRHTTIKNSLGQSVIIPNSVISKNAVIHLPPPERVVVNFAVTTESDLDYVAEAVEAKARRIASEIDAIVEEPRVLFTEVTEFGLTGNVSLEIEHAEKATEVSDSITRAIAPDVLHAGQDK